jgi:hypothetical protein
MTQGDGVTVDLTVLTTYAHNMGTLADRMQVESTNYDKDLGSLGTGMLLSTMPGFAESGWFHRCHAQVAGSAGAFLMDCVMGAAALGGGAEVCALNYADVDHFSATQLLQISAEAAAGVKKGHLFGPLDFVVTGSAASNSSTVDNAFHPASGTALFDSAPPAVATAKKQPAVAADPKRDKAVEDEYEADVSKARDQAKKGQKVDGASSADHYRAGGYTVGKGATAIHVPKNQGPSDLTGGKPVTKPVTPTGA